MIKVGGTVVLNWQNVNITAATTAGIAQVPAGPARPGRLSPQNGSMLVWTVLLVTRRPIQSLEVGNVIDDADTHIILINRYWGILSFPPARGGVGVTLSWPSLAPGRTYIR